MNIKMTSLHKYIIHRGTRYLSQVQGKRVMYRYHRKSKNLYGSIFAVSFLTGEVYIKWEDGEKGWVSTKSVELPYK